MIKTSLPQQTFVRSFLNNPAVIHHDYPITEILYQGDIVTDPRSQAYYLVTEYGRVNLVGKTTWERAEDIISLAHPDFREALIAEAEELGIWRRSNKR